MSGCRPRSRPPRGAGPRARAAGVVREGESWAAAARRTCASMHAEPEPLDLSGEVKQFVVDHDTRVALRAMTRGDLRDVVALARQPSTCSSWWSPGEPPTLARSSSEVRRADRRDEPRPGCGWSRSTAARSGSSRTTGSATTPTTPCSGPTRTRSASTTRSAIRLWRGRGLGQRMLWAWMLRARTPVPGRHDVLRGPDHRNVARCGCWPRRVHRGALVRRAAGER